jgi:sensor histidine kinase YesM
MKVKTFSYRFAEEILQHPLYKAAYDELIQVCEECPVPVYTGKSVNQPEKDVVQQLMNSFFFKRFKSLGWETEPLATPDENADELRSDFRKTFIDEETGEVLLTLQIEVEFGNVASSYRNYFKFQLSYAYSLTDICVLIVPSQHLSIRIDSGVSNFEKTCREIPSAKLSITVPTLVIGLFDDDVPEWNVKEITTDLKVLKNSNKNVTEEHYAIVQGYIDRIEERH